MQTHTSQSPSLRERGLVSCVSCSGVVVCDGVKGRRSLQWSSTLELRSFAVCDSVSIVLQLGAHAHTCARMLSHTHANTGKCTRPAQADLITYTTEEALTQAHSHTQMDAQSQTHSHAQTQTHSQPHTYSHTHRQSHPNAHTDKRHAHTQSQTHPRAHTDRGTHTHTVTNTDAHSETQPRAHTDVHTHARTQSQTHRHAQPPQPSASYPAVGAAAAGLSADEFDVNLRRHNHTRLIPL